MSRNRVGLCILLIAMIINPELSAQPLSTAPAASTQPARWQAWTPPFGLDRVGASHTGQPFEADAVATAEPLRNPVDLGTILVPAGWIVVGPDQTVRVRAAAIDREKDSPGTRVEVWYDSSPDRRASRTISLRKGDKQVFDCTSPPMPTSLERDQLHVAIFAADGQERWHKRIPVMIVRSPPRWPMFGAAQTRLRYDAPISVRDPATGQLSSMSYDGAWPAELQDVVVSLPNGSRFVFWRGASYVPFWASAHNTGLSYEWAETGPLPEGFVDSVEPLMDKELRYGRVQIIESTPARVHVRWTYQSTDFLYKVWGDAAQEDFYFYPDGYGTRCLTLKSAPDADYELSEFILLTSQGTYPFSALPSDLVHILFLDGKRLDVNFPVLGGYDALTRESRDVPPVYRVRLHKDDPHTAIYFTPQETRLPPVIFGAFQDDGHIVTPCYWGSHWPLARGKTTGGAIDDRIHVTPAHNSIMSFARQRPTPLSTATMPSIDTLGRSRSMRTQVWAWMIGLTDESDDRVLQRARSFAQPPSIELKGARLDTESYVPTRRAIRIIPDSKDLTITLLPKVPCLNPVFEFAGEPGRKIRVSIDGRELDPAGYAWDGHILWLAATYSVKTEIRVSFTD